MTEPERSGGAVRIKEIGIDEAEEIEATGLGGPKLYIDGGSKHNCRAIFANPPS